MVLYQRALAAICIVISFAATSALTQNVLDPQFQSAAKPFGGSATLGNSLGVGTFVSGYGNAPEWVSTLSLSPMLRIPVPAGVPAMNLILSGDLYLNWLDSNQSSTTQAQRVATISDISLVYSVPQVWKIGATGLFLGTSARIVAPSSLASQALQRVGSAGASVTFGGAWGDFFVGLTPSASGNVYAGASKLLRCDQVGSNLPPVVNPSSPEFGLDAYTLALTTTGSSAGHDGYCVTAGRQTLATLRNGLSASWAHRGHAVSVSLGWRLAFLRGLEDRPELRADNASTQDFTETSDGTITYSYQIPVDFFLSVGGGVYSFQSSYNQRGQLNFPFYDFFTPSKNQTQFFVNVTAGI